MLEKSLSDSIIKTSLRSDGHNTRVDRSQKLTRPFTAMASSRPSAKPQSNRPSTAIPSNAKLNTLPASPNTTAVLEKETPNLDYSEVIIHVLDEKNNLKRDFHCQKSILLSEAKYFTSILKYERSANSIIEIEVHSDVIIFELLIDYCNTHVAKIGMFFLTGPKTVVSTLISSNYLQMDSLERICLDYMKTNINEIIKVLEV